MRHSPQHPKRSEKPFVTLRKIYFEGAQPPLRYVVLRFSEHIERRVTIDEKFVLALPCRA